MFYNYFKYLIIRFELFNIFIIYKEIVNNKL